MKQLLTNVIQTKELTAKGKEVTVNEFALQVRGEETDYSSEDVTFKVLATYSKLLQWNKEGNRVLNETVYFEAVPKGVLIPDRLGGNACGRIFPSWQDKKSFSPSERDAANPNNAKWYTFLFGEVTFPGKAPVLVNYRITGNQCFDFGAIEKAIKDKGAKLNQTLLKLSAVPREGKEHLATTEYTILQTDLDASANAGALQQIEEFIEVENGKIKDEHNAALAAKKTA